MHPSNGIHTRLALAALALAIIGFDHVSESTGADRPNVILIMSDDQGYGDFGFQGNPVIETPNLDAMAARSARLERFYVSPVCAPTRACLMTGRYNYRTRAIDTYIGRAMMEPEETTLAEMLRGGGYATGIFGKWHLGDNYPMRPTDQGFEEALVHRGGGIGQPSDPPGGEGKYTNPVLFHNNERIAREGYCTDIFFDAAIDWMSERAEADQPFFACIPTNAPHGPFDDVPEMWYEHYKAKDLGNDRFPQNEGHPLPEKADLDKRARIFAMISNIDENVGKLFDALERHELTHDTLVLFMVDNGPNSRRYVTGFRGAKSEVYEGGIRSPLLAHLPGVLEPGIVSGRIGAHIDIAPTVLQACGLVPPKGVRFDGTSLWPVLTESASGSSDHTIFIQTHRGDVPVRYHQFAEIGKRWKLLHASGFGREGFEGNPKFELYDLENDPYEMKDLADDMPDRVEEMRKGYDRWFDDVGSTRPDNYAPPLIHIGSERENPVTLTRQDWRHAAGRLWAADSRGYWKLYVERAGNYEVTLRMPPAEKAGMAFTRFYRTDVFHGEPPEQSDNELLFEVDKVSGVAYEQGSREIRSQVRLPEGPVDFYPVLYPLPEAREVLARQRPGVLSKDADLSDARGPHQADLRFRGD